MTRGATRRILICATCIVAAALVACVMLCIRSESRCEELSCGAGRQRFGVTSIGGWLLFTHDRERPDDTRDLSGIKFQSSPMDKGAMAQSVDALFYIHRYRWHDVAFDKITEGYLDGTGISSLMIRCRSLAVILCVSLAPPLIALWRWKRFMPMNRRGSSG